MIWIVDEDRYGVEVGGGGGKYGIGNSECELAVESEGELEAVEMELWDRQCGLVVGSKWG